MFSGTAITNTRYVSRWNISSLRSIKHMFSKNDALTNVNTLSDWDTSDITDMSYLFYNDNNLTDFMNYGVRNWNTGSVTDMSYMFYSTKINYPTALDGWDVSAVRNFRSMFAYCSTSSDTIVSLNSLSAWQVSSDADTTGMFNGLRTRYGYPSWYNDW